MRSLFVTGIVMLLFAAPKAMAQDVSRKDTTVHALPTYHFYPQADASAGLQKISYDYTTVTPQPEEKYVPPPAYINYSTIAAPPTCGNRWLATKKDRSVRGLKHYTVISK